MKFIAVGRNKRFDNEYANEFIQRECGGKEALHGI